MPTGGTGQTTSGVRQRRFKRRWRGKYSSRVDRRENVETDAPEKRLRLLTCTCIENNVSWSIHPVSPPAPRSWSFTVVIMAVTLVASLPLASGAVPEYKLGDVATEDVITPVPLLVVNPEATDALKEKVAQQSPSIVRYSSEMARTGESDLRSSIASARTKFLTALDALQDRVPSESDLGTPEYAAALDFAARNSAKKLPLDRFTPLWLRGQSDQELTDRLIAALREAMAQPILAATAADSSLPPNQLVKLVPVKEFSDAVSSETLEGAGPTLAPWKLISVARAQQLVEAHFSAGEEVLGAFAATFVRANASYDPSLTEVIRAKRTTSLAVNDQFEAAQVIIHRGQTVDRRALSALAVLREKSMIGTLQSKLEQEKSVAGQIKHQTTWMAAGLSLVAGALLLILWRLRSRPAPLSVSVREDPALPNSAQAALPGGGEESTWQNRALAAEGKAERAHEAIRSGALGWMRDKIFRTMFHQRAELLSAQRTAEADMRELEQRLEHLQTPLQDRITGYEKRIQELEQELAAKAKVPPAIRPVVTTPNDADRSSRRLELTLAEREQAIGDAELRVAERIRDLDELGALLRAREALLASDQKVRVGENSDVIAVRGAETLRQFRSELGMPELSPTAAVDPSRITERSPETVPTARPDITVTIPPLSPAG